MLRSLRILAFLAIVPLLYLLLGCGGGSGAIHGLPAGGTVTLPAGSVLNLADLTVFSALGTAPVTADGAFTAQEPNSGPALAGLFDKAGNLILLGYIDADDPAGGAIDAKSTAVALLFQAIGGYLVPTGEWKKLLGLIADSPQAETLAAVIAARVAANPTALLDGDNEIRDALATAAPALAPPETEGAKAPVVKRSLQFAVNRAATDVTKIAILNPGKQSGAEVQLNTDGSGIVIANGYRRHLIYYIYRTGYIDKDNQKHSYPWVEVTHNYLTATSGVTGLVSAVIDYAAGTVAYGDTTTPPINLPLEPADAKRTLYTVVVIGPGADMDLPPELDDATAAQKAEWLEAGKGMIVLEWFKEFFLPAVFAFIPAKGFEENFKLNKENVQFALDLANMFTQGGLDIGTALASNDYKGTAVNAVKALASNGSLRDAIFKKIGDKMLQMGMTTAATTLGNAVTKINFVMSVVDKVLTVGDIGAVSTQLAMSSVYTFWNLAANKLDVTIVPNAANATKVGTPVGLSCQVSGLTGATLTYHWETTGKYGHLEDDRNHSGTSFDSTMAAVRYVPDKIEDGKSDEVTVEAYLVPEGGVGTKQDLGQGTAVITCRLTKEYTIQSFGVDDNMTLWVNGEIVYEDYDGAYAGVRGPFVFEASPGDTIRIQVRDYYGYYASIGDVVVEFPDGTTQKIWTGFQIQTSPGTHAVIFDETWTIP